MSLQHPNGIEWFGIHSFVNAFDFQDKVLAGDLSSRHGTVMADDNGSVDWWLYRELAMDGDSCVRMKVPGMVLIEKWRQAICLVRDPRDPSIWHGSWVDVR